MKLISVVVLLALCASAGCTNSKNRLAFDGEYFRIKVAKVDKQRDVFTVTIRDVDRSLDGAREAGRHAGVSYCVETYGSSKINWSVGPDTPPEELRIVDNTLVFQGVCPQV
jgi:hypothetical protein